MKTGLMKRVAGWASAGVVMAALAGVAVVLSAGGSKPGKPPTGPANGRPGSEVSEGGRGPQPVRVKTISATREDLTQAITEPAHVDPYQQADLFAKVAGYLRKVHVDIGDRVKTDQVLAELWIPEMEQERVQKAAIVEQAKADLASEQAELEQVKAKRAEQEAEKRLREVELRRISSLVKDGSLAQEKQDEAQFALEMVEAAIDSTAAAIDVAHAHVNSAKARINVAQADMEYAAIRLNYGKIVAPYDGVITQRSFHSGDFIQSAETGKAEPLFTIARVDRMRIVTAIREAHVSAIRVGQRATLKVDAARGPSFSGRVARLADALDPQSRTMLLEVELDARADVLRPGMFGQVTISLADYTDALLLPTSALAVGGAKPSVLCVEAGRAHRREVELGYNDGVRVQITRGLSGDEQIITDGKAGVRDGQIVEVVN